MTQELADKAGKWTGLYYHWLSNLPKTPLIKMSIQENNKYYTPDITDIRVGYECEKIQMGEFDTHYDIFLKEDATQEDYNKVWDKHHNSDRRSSIKHIIKKEELIELLRFTGDLRTGPGIPISGFFRTPYLTKDQIETEGWEDTGDHYLGFCNKQGVGLKYNFDTKKLNILKPSGGLHHEVFIGNCLSINELRTIQKLLGI